LTQEIFDLFTDKTLCLERNKESIELIKLDCSRKIKLYIFIFDVAEFETKDKLLYK